MIKPEVGDFVEILKTTNVEGILLNKGDKFKIVEILPFTECAIMENKLSVYIGEEENELYRFIKYIPILVQSIDHSNHTVVQNQVLGKPFKYCRDCKVEV